jgi:hypothetical protein
MSRLPATDHTVIKQVLPAELTQRIGREIDRALASIADETQESLESVGRLVTAWCGRTDFVSSAVQQAMPYVRSSLEQTEGCEDVRPELVSATLFVNAGMHRKGTHAHQDLAYRWYPTAVPYAYTTWVALDGVDEDHDGLLFRPGSLNSALGDRQDFLDADFVDQCQTADWRSVQVAPRLQNGDAVCFSSLMWHASAPCKPGVGRRALALRWKSCSGWEDEALVSKPTIDEHRFGMDTSGRLFSDSVANAFPQSAGDVADGDPLSYASWLLNQSTALARLEQRSAAAVLDLKRALILRRDYGGRPAASVWTAIRDFAIPSLTRILLAGGGV